MAAIAKPVQGGMINRHFYRHLPTKLLVMIADNGVAEFGGTGRAMIDKLAVNDIAGGDQRDRIARHIADKTQPAA